ncbi:MULTISPECIES: CGNR zinc finger domain-containing protein [Rhodococcus]|uniref:CGNR zinc finger domain-containing protein n=1 Tax=Rhodococcus TaxID=1827 RepID=UPI00068EF929|nr:MULTISPECIES: CGNR zinc finger domain-containing protein [Rhodococcus]AOD23158.1 hypothetical protein IM25_17445 [Rhodococcus sp. p52]QQM55189.1 CGNR zinc finger domain-containing protein [Rhodococcus pyridinivorans]UTM39314.1 CGNR zinc finger domain-containing protein [Rhodococcus pyridinivorans]
MRTQYIENGVLVRPLEPPSTNFLSSRYYDGRGITDLFDSPDRAHAWMQTLNEEISFPRSPFTPTEDQLAQLRQLRDTLGSVYRDTLDGDPAQAAAHLRTVLDRTRITPGIVVGDDRLHVRWTTDSHDPFEELVAEIAVSAITAVTGHAATLLCKCEAPRCVLYFTRLNARQHWCSDVCGNRARVARAARTRRKSHPAEGSQPKSEAHNPGGRPSGL